MKKLAILMLAIALGLLVSGCSKESEKPNVIYMTSDGVEHSTQEDADRHDRERPPSVRADIKRIVMEHGYVKLYGTITNTGRNPLSRVQIQVEILDESGKVKLSVRNFLPEGGSTIAPNETVAFSTIQSVPGEPDHVRYEVTIGSNGVKIPNQDIRYPK